MIEASLAECAEAEEKRRLKYRPKKDQSVAPADTPKSEGLGIASRIAPKKEESEETVPAATAPVVVNVNNNNGVNSADAAQIEKLAGYVVKGPSYLRDSRLRTAVDVLKSMTEDKDERAQLAANLDAAVKKLEAKEGNTNLKTSAINKLKEFLR